MAVYGCMSLCDTGYVVVSDSLVQYIWLCMVVCHCVILVMWFCLTLVQYIYGCVWLYVTVDLFGSLWSSIYMGVVYGCVHLCMSVFGLVYLALCNYIVISHCMMLDVWLCLAPHMAVWFSVLFFHQDRGDLKAL